MDGAERHISTVVTHISPSLLEQFLSGIPTLTSSPCIAMTSYLSCCRTVYLSGNVSCTVSPFTISGAGYSIDTLLCLFYFSFISRGAT